MPKKKFPFSSISATHVTSLDEGVDVGTSHEPPGVVLDEEIDWGEETYEDDSDDSLFDDPEDYDEDFDFGEDYEEDADLSD